MSEFIKKADVTTDARLIITLIIVPAKRPYTEGEFINPLYPTPLKISISLF